MEDEKIEVYKVDNHGYKHLMDKVKGFFSFFKGSKF